MCAPVIRQRRAVEVDEALRAHLAAGGGCEFLTLTARHRKRDPLAARLDVMAQALRHLLRGSGWQRRRDRLGYVGSIRALEVTWGEVNGWHPHTHAMLLFDRPLTDRERADLMAWLFTRWHARLVALDLGGITLAHGIDLRPVTVNAGLGEYLTKVGGGWTPGLELTRSDRKGSSPFALLRQLGETGEARFARLWCEYERATFGRQSLVWSPGLRRRLCGVEEASTDAELAASEGLDLALLRAWVSRGEWARIVTAQRIAPTLAAIEDVAAVLLFVSDVMGVDVPPLDVAGGGDPP